ncbi:WD40 repeat domain-containing protein [Mariniblastus sp.]|nr:WD40 repeat domain-containing protein [Mariniblastus sp.]
MEWIATDWVKTKDEENPRGNLDLCLSSAEVEEVDNWVSEVKLETHEDEFLEACREKWEAKKQFERRSFENRIALERTANKRLKYFLALAAAAVVITAVLLRFALKQKSEAFKQSQLVRQRSIASFLDNGRSAMTAEKPQIASFWYGKAIEQAGQQDDRYGSICRLLEGSLASCGTPLVHDSEVLSVAFSTDGIKIATGCRLGAFVWCDAQCIELKSREHSIVSVSELTFLDHDKKVLVKYELGGWGANSRTELFSTVDGKSERILNEDGPGGERFLFALPKLQVAVFATNNKLVFYDLVKMEKYGGPDIEFDGKTDRYTALLGAQSDNAMCVQVTDLKYVSLKIKDKDEIELVGEIELSKLSHEGSGVIGVTRGGNHVYTAEPDPNGQGLFLVKLIAVKTGKVRMTWSTSEWLRMVDSADQNNVVLVGDNFSAVLPQDGGRINSIDRHTITSLKSYSSSFNRTRQAGNLVQGSFKLSPDIDLLGHSILPQTLFHGNSISAFTSHPKKLRIITGGNDGLARIWNARASEDINMLLGEPTTIKVSKDNSCVMSGNIQNIEQKFKADVETPNGRRKIAANDVLRGMKLIWFVCPDAECRWVFARFGSQVSTNFAGKKRWPSKYILFDTKNATCFKLPVNDDAIITHATMLSGQNHSLFTVNDSKLIEWRHVEEKLPLLPTPPTTDAEDSWTNFREWAPVLFANFDRSDPSKMIVINRQGQVSNWNSKEEILPKFNPPMGRSIDDAVVVQDGKGNMAVEYTYKELGPRGEPNYSTVRFVSQTTDGSYVQLPEFPLNTKIAGFSKDGETVVISSGPLLQKWDYKTGEKIGMPRETAFDKNPFHFNRNRGTVESLDGVSCYIACSEHSLQHLDISKLLRYVEYKTGFSLSENSPVKLTQKEWLPLFAEGLEFDGALAN